MANLYKGEQKMIKIQNVNDAAYKRFGKVITDIELGDLLQAM